MKGFTKVTIDLGEMHVVSVQKQHESFAHDSMQKSEYDKLFNQQESYTDLLVFDTFCLSYVT